MGEKIQRLIVFDANPGPGPIEISREAGPYTDQQKANEFLNGVEAVVVSDEQLLFTLIKQSAESSVVAIIGSNHDDPSSDKRDFPKHLAEVIRETRATVKKHLDQNAIPYINVLGKLTDEPDIIALVNQHKESLTGSTEDNPL